MDNLIGKQIGRYQLIELLARGGMALVFKAQDTRLDRYVAFKILVPGAHHSDTFLKRFEREAKTLAQLTHPNIVPILDYGEFEGMPYLVMTYLPGGSLKERLGKPFPTVQAALLLRPIADALGYAHQRGLIHRDIKPGNILLTENSQPMLTDFGIVKLLESKDTENLTATGLGIGTPEYMSPEQAHGFPVDQRTDIYSLAIVLYEMVTGRKPFEADTPMSLLFKHVSEPVPLPRSILPTLSDEVEKVLLKALAKGREERYPDMAEFKLALEKLIEIKEARTKVVSPSEPIPDATEFDEEHWEAPPQIPEEPAPHPQIEAQTDVSLSTEDIKDEEAAINVTEVEVGPVTEVATSPYLHEIPESDQEEIESEEPDLRDVTRAVTSEELPAHAAVTNVLAPKPREETKKKRWLLAAIISLAVVVGIALITIFVIIPAIEGQEETASSPPVEAEQVKPTSMTQKTQVVSVEEEPEDEPVVLPIEEQTLNMVRIQPPVSLDPSYAYHLESWEVIGNIYETLVFYPRHNTDVFIPQLSDEHEVSPDGKTYRFHIREGVRFHNGAQLTASDVAYTFQRALLTGTEATPQWMLMEAILGPWMRDITILIETDGAMIGNRERLLQAEPDALFNVCMRIKEVIFADEDVGNVTFHLAQPWAPFMKLMAAPFSSIIDQDWAMEMGAWDGTCETWPYYYAQPIEENPLTTSTNGTGPYKLDHWEMDQGAIYLARNDTYWREEPMWKFGPSGNAFFQGVNIQYIPEVETRLDVLHSGETDLIEVSKYISAAEAENVGERCVEQGFQGEYACERISAHPMRLLLGNRPALQGFLTFNHNIQAPEGEAPFIGSGRLDGEGVPANFFTDLHIRQAFQSCFNWEEFNHLVYRDQGLYNPTIALPGMLGYNPEIPVFPFNLDECAAHFQGSEWASADGRPLWDVGFQLQLPFHSGISSMQVAIEILAVNINEINPNFHVEPLALNGEDYWFFYDQKALPIAFSSRFEDVYDPHYRYASLLVAYYAEMMNLPMESRELFNELLIEAAKVMDVEGRNEIYQQINWMVFEQSLFIHLGYERNHLYSNQRLKDYFYNPAYYGDYFYALKME